MKKVKEKAVEQNNEYIKVNDLKFYGSVRYCLDPKEYQLHERLSEAQHHEREASTQIEHAMNNY